MMKLSQLAFLQGSWQGEGFVMDFTEPVNTMVFGSMQAADAVGKTIYWETFRFDWVDDDVFLHTVTQGKDSGTYQSVDSEEGNQIRFMGHKNYHEKVQQILFKTVAPGSSSI